MVGMKKYVVIFGSLGLLHLLAIGSGLIRTKIP